MTTETKLPAKARMVRVFKDPMYTQRFAWDAWDAGNQSPYTGDYLSRIDAARDAEEYVTAVLGWRKGEYEVRSQEHYS